jgi:hypothetical protein
MRMRCYRDAHGRTPLDLLERAHVWPGVAAQLDSLPADVLPVVRERLKRRAEATTARSAPRARDSSPGGLTGAPPTPPPSDVRGGLSAAARLQEARTPAEVAAVLRGMTPEDLTHRVKLWARLPEAQRQALPLTAHSLERLAQVRAACMTVRRSTATDDSTCIVCMRCGAACASGACASTWCVCAACR